MAVREFNGSSDRIICAPGAAAVSNFCQGAHTVVAVVNRTTLTGTEAILGILAGSTGLGGLWTDSSNAGMVCDTTPFVFTPFAGVLTAGEWYILYYRKASGSAAIEAGNWNLETTPADYTTGSTGATTGQAGTPTVLEVGSANGGSWCDMRIATVAVFNSSLSDAALDSIRTGLSTQSIFNLTPIALWDFNQASVATAITDLIGSSSQSSISGTSVVTTDDPPGWTFGVSAAGQQLVPSADDSDGTWTTDTGGTSLFPAIDDEVDSAYIRSVLAPSNAGCRVALDAGQTPVAGTRTLRWRIGKDITGGGQIDMTIKLYQGGGATLGAGTLVDSFTRNNVDAATTFDETVTGTITDYADLHVEFFANQV